MAFDPDCMDESGSGPHLVRMGGVPGVSPIEAMHFFEAAARASLPRGCAHFGTNKAATVQVHKVRRFVFTR